MTVVTALRSQPQRFAERKRSEARTRDVSRATRLIESTKRFARAVAGELSRQHPANVTDVMAKSARPSKVFVDWSQNDAGKSTIAPYSLRGLRVPTVSAPVTWEEVAAVADGADPRLLYLVAPDVLERLDRVGDLLAPMLDQPQRLPG